MSYWHHRHLSFEGKKISQMKNGSSTVYKDKQTTLIFLFRLGRRNIRYLHYVKSRHFRHFLQLFSSNRFLLYMYEYGKEEEKSEAWESRQGINSFLQRWKEVQNRNIKSNQERNHTAQLSNGQVYISLVKYLTYTRVLKYLASSANSCEEFLNIQSIVCFFFPATDTHNMHSVTLSFASHFLLVISLSTGFWNFLYLLYSEAEKLYF